MVATVERNGRKESFLGQAPDGAALFFGMKKDAIVVSQLRWFLDGLLIGVTEGDDDDKMFASADGNNDACAVAWSRIGCYVLTTKKDCRVCLWDVNLKKTFGPWRSENTIQCWAWRKKTKAYRCV